MLDVKERFKKVQQNYLRDLSEYNELNKSIAKKDKEISDIDELKVRLDKSRVFLLDTSKTQRGKILTDIENIVSKALQYIKQEELFFIIKTKESRGREEWDFYIKSIREGLTNETPILEARGDGISDIVSFALDIAILELSGFEGPLVLDEPAKQLSIEYIENVGEFIKEISSNFDRQILLITHHQDLKDIGDKTFNVSLEGNQTVIQ